MDLVDSGSCYGYFLLLPFSYCFKRMFLDKKIQISCMGSKVSFWKNWKNCQNSLISALASKRGELKKLRPTYYDHNGISNIL